VVKCWKNNIPGNIEEVFLKLVTTSVHHNRNKKAPYHWSHLHNRKMSTSLKWKKIFQKEKRRSSAQIIFHFIGTLNAFHLSKWKLTTAFIYVWFHIPVFLSSDIYHFTYIKSNLELPSSQWLNHQSWALDSVRICFFSWPPVRR